MLKNVWNTKLSMKSYNKSKEIPNLESEFIKIKQQDGGWNCYLQIDHQSFCIIENTTKKRAKWYGEMLSKALERMINKYTK